MSLGRIEPLRTSAVIADADGLPSAQVIVDLHRDLVARKRRAFLISSPLLLLAGFAYLGAITEPRAFGGLAIFAMVTTALIAQTGYDWLTLRRADPVALWRREQQREWQQREEHIAHLQRTATLRPYLSIALVAVIIAVTIVEFAAGPIMKSVQAAGLVKPATRAGEWWRLLTASYLHGSLFHLFANANGLLILGRLIEAYDRRLRVPLVYLLGAVGGCLLSTFADSSRPSIGASGGVIALAGYLLVVAGSARGGTPAWVRRQMISIMASTAVLGIGAFMFIDNAGHLGGALTGALVGWAVVRSGDGGTRVFDYAGVASLAILGAGAAFTVSRLVFA